jgi:hypothetical protein
VTPLHAVPCLQLQQYIGGSWALITMQQGQPTQTPSIWYFCNITPDSTTSPRKYYPKRATHTESLALVSDTWLSDT